MNKGKAFSTAAAILLAGVLTACASSDNGGFRSDSPVTVISREESSGTRGAFIELFGIEQKNSSGEKVDRTVDTASITQSTGVMKTSVAQNEYAIGYISMGAMDDSVKALKIDGQTPSADNINSGAYKISRPFNIVTKSELSPAADDFVTFILSSQGQDVIEDNGYIRAAGQSSYSPHNLSGKITVAGSSSVTPVMEKLKEAYIALNPNVTVEINQSDSTTGINSTIEGICDIGMASRELKDSETDSGAISTVIAADGIAVIVSNDNPVTDLTSEQVREIYIGGITTWDSLVQ